MTVSQQIITTTKALLVFNKVYTFSQIMHLCSNQFFDNSIKDKLT